MGQGSPISRRQFLKNGALISGAALAATAGAPWLKFRSDAEAAIMGIGQELREILNGETCDRILAEALKRGGDFADLFAEQRYRTSIVLDDGKIDSVTYGYPRGAGVRVSWRRQTGYAFSDEVSYPDLLDAARVASTVVENQSPVRPIDAAFRTTRASFTLYSPAPMMDETAKFDLLRRMDAAARAVDPRVVSVRLEYQDEVRDVLISRSDGTYTTDRQYLVTVSCVPAAAQGDLRTTGFGSIGGRVEAEFFPRNNPEGVAQDAARQAITLLSAAPAPAGSMPVVIAPGWGGVLIHESFGHALEGDRVRQGNSILSGMYGAKVGAPILRVIDDATWPNGRGSYAVDDEATPGQRTVVIDRGVLQTYLLDRQSAGLMGLQPTGNGRRMSYRNRAIARMSNTYIDNGTSTPASLLNGITKGFYAAELGGGSVDVVSGNFNFAVRLGYLIENGRVTQPVRGAVLIGNSIETMNRIEGIGNDLRVETSRGTCGKDSQMVPVGIGQPTVRFSSITVGGRAI
jgi:TldD protein